MRPHRRQPTRLPSPWETPGKNTGVGCHFLLQCMKVKSESEVSQSCPTLSRPMDCSLPDSSVHGIFQARVLEWGAIAFSGVPTMPHVFLSTLKWPINKVDKNFPALIKLKSLWENRETYHISNVTSIMLSLGRCIQLPNGLAHWAKTIE